MSPASAVLDREALDAQVRRELFRSAAGPGVDRVGVEAEMIPVTHEGTPCPVEPDPRRPHLPATGPLLRAWATEHGWQTCDSPAGAPAFRLPHGGGISFEPGGQLEYSSPPFDGVDTLLADADRVLAPLALRAGEHGVRFLARGMDPLTPPDSVALQVTGERYRRMAAHYDRQGPAGRRMMRQTAALHLNLDLGENGPLRWRMANDLAPLLTALFANSPRAAGQETGHRSSRALQWRLLDPGRTGLRPPTADPEADYLDFALDADAFLLGPSAEPGRPFRAWLERGATLEDWRRHLTTLFPEVRPRGYLELRCLDALPLRWYGAPLAVAVGILHQRDVLEEALRSLPRADAGLLERAGRLGLGDPDLHDAALRALALAQEGLIRLGQADRALETLRAFRSTFSETGHDPGHASATDLLDR